jgi:hypothetical protein
VHSKYELIQSAGPANTWCILLGFVSAVDENQFREASIRRAHQRGSDRDDGGMAAVRFMDADEIVFGLTRERGKLDRSSFVVICRRYTTLMLSNHVVDIALDDVFAPTEHPIVDLRALHAALNHRLNLACNEANDQCSIPVRYLLNTCVNHGHLLATYVATPRSSEYVRNTSRVTG